jgi:cytoskeletal protein RodZ
VSVPFESGGRQRPVDVSVDDSDDIPIDGTRLKQERIERGISVNDAARMATLSREQIEQIEGGGLRAFYGARHKRLAAKKYADVFGIDLSELLPPEPVVSEVQGIATDSIPSAVNQSSVPATDSSRGVMAPASARSSFESRRLPLVAVIIVALVLTFSILRGLTPTPKPVTEPIPEPVAESAAPVEAVPAVPDQAAPASATASAPASTSATSPVPVPAPTATATLSATDTATATTAAPAPAAASAAKGEEGADPCAVAGGGEIARWAPTQVRATYTRLYLGSYTESTLCVVDAAGIAKPLKLKAGGTANVSGKPPYTIHSPQLPKLQIYLQGLKVKIPAGAVSIQLFTTQSLLPSDPEKAAASDGQ